MHCQICFIITADIIKSLLDQTLVLVERFFLCSGEAKTRSIHPIQEIEKGMRAPDPLLHPSMWNFLHSQPTYKNSKLGDPNQDTEKATCPISFKRKECHWIGFNSTSLLVWSGFDVPFGRHLTRRLYVAEFNFRVPHPCRFRMETFHCKVWASETKSNINIHSIFRPTAINTPKSQSKRQRSNMFSNHC